MVSDDDPQSLRRALADRVREGIADGRRHPELDETTPLIRRESSYPKGPLSEDVRGEERRFSLKGGAA